MKKIYTLFFALIVSGGVMAQPCPDSLYLTSQAQVDSFQILYPNCTEIEGDVYISGGDITNLNGLNVLTSVGEKLLIRDNPVLNSLSGLDNITSVGISVYIQNNAVIDNLTGMESMISVGGGFMIFSNPVLSSLTGLDNLSSIGGGLWIFDNAVLSSLSSLYNVTSVGNGYIGIYDNPALSSLLGLDNIDAESILELGIYDNEGLSACEILSICNFLADPNGDIWIYNNATGCNSQEEILDSCEANGVNVDEQFIADILSIYPNPIQLKITIELPTEPSNNTTLTISNTNGQQLITQPITKPQTEIDVSQLPAGIYIVKIWNDKDVMVRKVVKR